MSAPELSVVVPFYNLQDYLNDSLESIRRQTFTNFEVILVDDGSTDDGARIVKDFCTRDSRFRLIQKENAGVGPARNTGIADAQAPLLAFVDGDDLVPWNTYSLLTRTIQETGSSFVLGNAKRFSRTSGVRASWTHQSMCASTVFGTHIQERPSLLRDRMVWNKIYRRDFWDAGGYQFPSMRYEDYPIALEAHFDALTVDVLASPCYYWRVRESGDSITQQVFKYDNLLDRVVSAEMILDLIDARAMPAVAGATHNYLAEIDLVALAQAFAVVPDEDVDNLLALGDRLTGRLRADMAKRPRFDQIQYYALKEHDVPLLRELARFRDDGGLAGGVRARRRRTRPWLFDGDYPGRQRSTAPQRAYSFPVTALTLRTQVDRLTWRDGRLQVVGTAEINHLPTDAAADLKVSVVSGIERIPLPLNRFEAPDQHGELSMVGFEATIDVDALAATTTLIWPLRLEVSLQNAGLHRVGLLRNLREGSPGFPNGRWLTDGEWIEPGRTSGGVFVIRHEVDPVVLDDARFQEGALELRGTLPERCTHAELKVSRPGNAGDLRIPARLDEVGSGSSFTVRLTPGSVLDGDSPDDPFTLRAQRRLTVDTDLGEFSLLWPHYDGDVSCVAQDRKVSLTRTSYAVATITHAPPLPSASRIDIDDDQITVVGMWWPGHAPSTVCWRRYLPNSDDHVDIVCPLDTTEGGEWSARSALSDLLPPEDAVPLQPGGPRADWTLFTRVDDADYAISCPPSVAQTLPRTLGQDGHRSRVTTLAGTVRVQVN